MKAYNFLIVTTISLTLASCIGRSDRAGETTSGDNSAESRSDNWQSRYDMIEADELPDNVVRLISQDWMLVTAGNEESFNMMTASWGGMGNVWSRPASFIFIRGDRYTNQFLQREEGFTLSFFTEDYKPALIKCGSVSGRDADKVKESGLTPTVAPSGLISFEEARMIVECRKMFVQELDYNRIEEPYKSKILADIYDNGNQTVKHQMYISEITNIWVKK